MRYIDTEQIYSQTDHGLTIFQHYFPGVDLRDNRKFFKLRESERSASARLSWYGGSWRITDFGNQSEINSLKAIEFVMWREGLPYYDALLFIEEVILNRKIDGKAFVRSKFQADYEMREVGPGDVKGEYSFVFKRLPSPDDLSAIGRYVDADTLQRFNCRTVESYSLCAFSKKHNKDVVHVFKSNKDYPIFLFDYGSFKKLYKPHEQDKKYRFSYIGEKPADYVYGLTQIETADNEFVSQDPDDEEALTLPEGKENARVIDLFRCSGESDAMNLAALGFHVYWLNSESADLDWRTYKKIDDLCQNHYQILDLDRTGQAQAFKNALKHINIYNIELPSWLQFKRDWRGNPCKDLKDFINLSGDDADRTTSDFLALKRSARRAKFWDKTVDPKTKKVNYNINMEFFFFFLKVSGFYQMDSIYHTGATYCYAKITDKVVTLIHPKDIKRIVKRFTKDFVKSRKLFDEIAVLNKINTSAQLTESNIESVENIEIEFRNHSQDAEYIHFKNGSIKISRDEISRVPHADLPNFILGELVVNNKKISHLIERDIRLQKNPAIEVTATAEFQKLLDALEKCSDQAEREKLNAQISLFPEVDKYSIKVNDEGFIFTEFIRDLARIHWRKEMYDGAKLNAHETKEQNLLLANIMFVLGYHCAQFKDMSKPWITYTMDNLISEIGKASGGSGKSILQKAPTFVRASFYIPGRELNQKDAYKFIYDGMTEFHDYIEVDDFHEYADFGFFYTQATGPRKINPKNYSAVTLPYHDSGKVWISSNYELPNLDGSTLRRLLMNSVSDYYHEATKYNDYRETRTPASKFGKQLYDDFTDEEWNKFYNFIAYCIQLHMRFNKIQPPTVNIEKRQMRRMMSQGLGREEEFLHWANDYFAPLPTGETLPDNISPSDKGYFNSLIIRDNAFENFTQTLTSRQRNEYKSGKFKKHLEAWAQYRGYTLNPEEICTDIANRRILKSIEGRTREIIYISNDNSAPPPPMPPEEELPF